MGFIPRIKPSLLAKVFALVYEHMACVAQGRDPVVVSLDAHALAIALLVRMGGYNRPILSPAPLTRAVSYKVKQFPVTVHLVYL
jgi:hypothetical protein